MTIQNPHNNKLPRLSARFVHDLVADSDVISFDVFDTVLLRNTKSETDRFYEISKLWAEYLKDDDISADNLLYARLLAAKICYRQAEKKAYCREAKHSDILKLTLSLASIPEIHSREFKKIETNYELKNLVYNEKFTKLIKHAKSQNKKVLAISDMYFDEDLIKELIVGVSPNLHFDNIYSSSVSGLNKASNELYKHVADKENIKMNARWVHFGDNLNSDVIQAKHLGISAYYTPRGMCWRAIAYIRRAIAKSKFKLRNT
jgi:predicted HAD superfamily hydrolase